MSKTCVFVQISTVCDAADIAKNIAKIPGKKWVEKIESVLFHSRVSPFDLIVSLTPGQNASTTNTIKDQICKINGVVLAITVSLVEIPIK